MKFLYEIFGGNNEDETGTKVSPKKRVGFEEVKAAIVGRGGETLLINTLSENDQHCLIAKTLSIADEITILNECIGGARFSVPIILYGRNHTDETAERKQSQLRSLGFTSVSVYLGGLFEWLLLQDIYGKQEFPTTLVETDLLRFKPTTAAAATKSQSVLR